MNFNEIVKKVEETKDLTLDELFELWKGAQAVEEEWEETTVSGEYIDEFRTHFTKDGIIDPDAYASSEYKVLVVLKEPNLGQKEKEFFAKEDDHRNFYNIFVSAEYSSDLKALISSNKTSDSDIDNGAHQKELVGRMSFFLQNLLQTKKFTEKNPSAGQIQKALKSTAVMNLNKRGGKESTNKGTLYRYCKKYVPFIRREIELIKPDIVVWCAWKSLEHVGYVPENIPVIDMYHTAYVRMPNKLPELLKACGNSQLNQVLEKLQSNIEDSQIAYNRHVAKYMLVFGERVRDAMEKGKLKL